MTMAPLDTTDTLPKTDSREALAFLAAIGPHHHLTAIPASGRPLNGRRVELPRDAERAAAWIAARNAEDMGIYWTANETRADFSGIKAAKEDVAMLRAVWLDLDCDKGTTAAAMMERLRAFAVAPSLLVHSGGGLQPVWLLDQSLPADAANVEALEALGRDLRMRLGGDAVEDVSRVLRVPGTVNWPNAAKKARGRVPALARRLDAIDGGAILTGAPVAFSDLRAAVDAAPVLPEGDKAAERATGGAVMLPGARPAVFDGDTTAGSGAQALQAGIEPRDGLLMALPEDQRVALLRAALKVVAPACGDREPWMQVIRALRSVEHHVPEVHDEALAWSRDVAPGWTGEADFAKAWATSPPRPGGTTVGTLIAMARAEGLDVAPWAALADGERARQIAEAASATTVGTSGASGAAEVASNHLMGEVEALAWGNAHFAYVRGFSSVVATDAPGKVRSLSDSAFALEVANRKVRVTMDNAVKVLPFGPWWRQHSQRREVDAVAFDPERKLGGNIINLDQGLGVVPRRGDCRLMLRHIYRVICRRDGVAFKYLIRWLAFSVQRRGTAPGVAVILQSRFEGTGKSTLGDAMVRVLGAHGLTVPTPEALLGNFNGHLARASFVQASEVSFAGNHDMARKLKALLTDETLLVNEKYQAARSVPNVVHLLMTTNEARAVDAGAHARRFLVLDVSPERRGDGAYWTALHQQMGGGGLEAFADFLLRVDLRGWNPREVPRTAALLTQQLESADLVTRYALACRDQGGLPGADRSTGSGVVPWGHSVTAATLRKFMATWARDTGTRGDVPSDIALGRWLRAVGATSKRVGTERRREWTLPDLPVFVAGALREAGIGP